VFGCASSTLPGRARVVVLGGGYGGATAAKYVRLFSQNTLDVLLIEPNAAFVSCPISNLVLSGHRTLAELTVPYSSLEKNHGVRHVRDTVARIDPVARKVVLASGPEIGYDKLIVSPGIDLNFDAIEGLRHVEAKIVDPGRDRVGAVGRDDDGIAIRFLPRGMGKTNGAIGADPVFHQECLAEIGGEALGEHAGEGIR
jgi:NADPH-dependent 2,4-dienoyl-CoA reductase/sulfur reductase-like enzyme